jgi:dTDP-glucose pyrophosphorylase
MKLNLIIPAAGMGSRFRNIGVETPKPLIPIFDLPMIYWVIGNFQLTPEDVIWIITRKEDEIPSKMEYLLPNITSKVHFIEIDKLTDGAATTLQFALERIPDHEVVLCANSDQFISTDLTPFMELVRSRSSEGQILTMKASGNKWSYVERDLRGEIIRVVEKVQVSDEATVGVYGWKSAEIAQNSIKDMKADAFKVNGEFYVAPTYNYLLCRGGKIETFNVGLVESDVHGLGTPEDLELFLSNLDISSYLEKVRANLGYQE